MKIEKLEGWGKLSIKFKYSIEKSKKVSGKIYIFGIRHIGQENAKLIADNLKDIKNL